MNYLAHATLSFHNPELLLGNMISDYIKGKKQFDYPAAVQDGIRLHRLIDRFTDDHPVNKSIKRIFQPHYRLYAGAIVDVIYDHFLALDPTQYPNHRLAPFSQWVYQELAQYQEWFPPYFSAVFPYMQSQDWLTHYREPAGIQKSLHGIQRRAKYMPPADFAFDLFEQHYGALQQAYQAFFPELVAETEKARVNQFRF